ncbi:MAG: glycerophosphodiester phosphodiesterase [Pseudomonadota bacterium]|uniref:glycerophosphodiester phosphodiesterase n=1 Tax=unclassified Phenylobacterium TaxID=2640670 RepID=UPI0006F7A0C9|nr:MULTISPECIES: glycerophosphodiester phosphodiesterase [unclassified Phenylobacterium]KRB44733.1 glycerophosphodiester phosphodiesterase [Phenylobacterium sp. Root700]MBT9472239.1 glycerophosphodiester phosphodiesterase [Phenylobacterium sp.]
MKNSFGEAWDLLFHPPVAHRGLWTPGGAPENSLGAFQAARQAGYGVELDVQLSADGEAVVFHDDNLKRMTGAEGRIRDYSAADLAQMKLAGTDEYIPTLLETLAVIGRRVMVHVELKTPYGEVGPLEQRVHEVLMDHVGPTCVIGFNPYSHAWFADRFPGVLRGLDSYDYKRAPHLADVQRESFARLEHVAIARPHFLAMHIDMLPDERVAKHRAEGMPVVGWTVRDPAQWDAVKDHCDNLIFEGFAA